MSNLTIEPIQGKVFGATITGVHLGKLTDQEFERIHAAFLEYGFLVFPGQFLTEQENIDFGLRYGELEFGGVPMSNQKRLAEGSYRHLSELHLSCSSEQDLADIAGRIGAMGVDSKIEGTTLRCSRSRRLGARRHPRRAWPAGVPCRRCSG